MNWRGGRSEAVAYVFFCAVCDRRWRSKASKSRCPSECGGIFHPITRTDQCSKYVSSKEDEPEQLHLSS